MANSNDLNCSVCGFEFSSTPTKSSDLLPTVIAQKGLVCGKCGQLYCANCAPKNHGTWVCRCGGVLHIRGLESFGL